MKIVVGLGNPGKKYEGTRHNVGFEVVERLARECGADGPRPKFDGDLWECRLGGEKSLLLEPRTFMNLSGSCVRKAFDFYQTDLADLLVVCDEFQLPVGQVRLKPQGSDGGHNGLADVIRALGTVEFAAAADRHRAGPRPVGSGGFCIGKVHRGGPRRN